MTSTPDYTDDFKKTHCSDVKYESEGQLKFPVDCDGDIGPSKSDEMKLLENIPHFLTVSVIVCAVMH